MWDEIITNEGESAPPDQRPLNVSKPSSPRRAISAVAEDYLKAIYSIEQEGEHAATNRVAQEMRTSPAAASKMLKQLAVQGMIEHTPYYGARLTPAGRRIALEIVRHHRLLEAYLHEIVGYGWEEVDAEAERLEHHISEGFEDRIDRILNFPRFDPHGHPIPDRDGAVAPLRGKPLTEFTPGDRLVLVRVSDVNPDVLRLLSTCGVSLYTQMELVDRQTELSGKETLTVRRRTDDETASYEACVLPLPDAHKIFADPCTEA